jgi:hypothetical protein
LTRRIITFTKVGGRCRRDEEEHRQQLYKAPDIAAHCKEASLGHFEIDGSIEI